VIENADLRVLLTTDEIADAVNFVERLHVALPALAAADAGALQLEAAPLLRSIVLLGESTGGGMIGHAEFEALADTD